MYDSSPFRPAIYGMLIAILTCGCMSIPDSETISPSCVPNGLNNSPRSNKQNINFIRLRQDQPEYYILGPDDTLGVYVASVLGERDQAPPIHQPEEGSGLPPAIGYPIPIREDGTITLPLILGPIPVAGLTLAQAENEIRKAYTITQKILQPDQAKIMVSLIKPRTYQVMVIREDARAAGLTTQKEIGEVTIGNPQQGSAEVVELRAYQNDVLHALTETGGLPGLNAKNEVVILRGAFEDARGRNAILDQYMGSGQVRTADGTIPNILRIPLRVSPGEQLPVLKEEDIILNDGDIVFIQSRDAEVFYTGGLLMGGMHPLPRDFDLDIFGAVSMSGGSIAAAAGGSGSRGSIGGTGVGTIFPPTRVIVLREMNGQQQAIRIDIKEAMRDPSQRILIQPNDVILLEYTTSEMLMNVIISNLRVSFALDSLWN